MDKFTYYRWFIGCFHTACLALSVAASYIILRKDVTAGLLARSVMILSCFVLVEAVNFLWLYGRAEEIFGIKGQALEVGRFHLFIVGSCFLAALLIGLLAGRYRWMCLAASMVYIITGLIAVIWFEG